MFVRLVGDRDARIWEYGDRTRFFHRGLSAEDTSPESPVWYDGWKSTSKYESQGIIIEKAFTQQAKDILAQFGFEVMFHGHRCWAVNSPIRGSDYFEQFFPDYDAWIVFSYANSCWSVSLYSKTIDVAAIASEYEYKGKRCWFSMQLTPIFTETCVRREK